MNWHFLHPTTGGPEGDGDGFLRVNGTSLGLAPCTPQAGSGRWSSPLFTYSGTTDANWDLSFDVRQSYQLYGDGHAGYAVEIMDDAGRVVTTASPPSPTMPLNQWLHRSVSFDGSKLVHGKQYRISVKVAAVHAETAASWGNLDFDNITLTATPKPGAAPVQICKGTGTSDLAALLTGRGDLCPTTRRWGASAEPILKIGNELAKTGPVKSMLDTARGAFAVVDLGTGQFIGWGFPKEGIPGSDPRDILVYTRNGTLGEAGNYAILFFTRNPQMMIEDVTGGPGGLPGAVASTFAGQITNAQDLLADPGRLIDIHPEWSFANLQFLLGTILDPIMSGEDAPDTALGGRVWKDANRDGIMTAGESGVKGVQVTLTNSDGDLIATQQTGADGTYEFENLDPTSDPEQYRLTFAPGSVPDGLQFTTRYASGGPAKHSVESTADPETGTTPEIVLARGQRDLTWHAGLIDSASDPARGVTSSAAAGASPPPAKASRPRTPAPKSAPASPTAVRDAKQEPSRRAAGGNHASGALPRTGASSVETPLTAGALLLLSGGAALLVTSSRRRRGDASA